MLLLPDELTQLQAKACLDALLAQLGAGTETVVTDASKLRHFDSSALAVLLAVRRAALAAGRSFEVRGLPVKLRELAGLYGVAGLLSEAS